MFASEHEPACDFILKTAIESVRHVNQVTLLRLCHAIQRNGLKARSHALRFQPACLTNNFKIQFQRTLLYKFRGFTWQLGSPERR